MKPLAMKKIILLISALLIIQSAFAGQTRCRDLIYPFCPGEESVSLWKPTNKNQPTDCMCQEIVDQPNYGTVSCANSLDGNVDQLYQYSPNTTCAIEDTFSVIECCITIEGLNCDTIQYMLHLKTDCETPADKFCCVPGDGNPANWDVLTNDQNFITQLYPGYALQTLEIQNITVPPLFGTASIMQSFSIVYTPLASFMGIDSVSYEVFYEVISPMNDTITICDEQTAYFLVDDCLETNVDEFSLTVGDTIYFNPLNNDLIASPLSTWCPDSLTCQNPIPQIDASSLGLTGPSNDEISIDPITQLWCFSAENGGNFLYTYEVCNTDSICDTEDIIIRVAETCETTLTAAGNVASGVYSADSIVYSNGSLQNQTVNFRAGSLIFLDTSFYSGLDFTATIESCDCPNNERAILETLYNDTDGTNWINTWNLTASIASWYGVTLNENGCVSHLNLSANNLTGNIPAELGSLTELQYLYLDNNQLEDKIPPELSNLSNLRVMALNDNLLDGNIPVELGLLGELRFLRLSDNDLTGGIPSELGNLSNLVHLLLYENELTGTIPASIANLTDLEFLRVYNNLLSGCYDTAISPFCSQLDAASNNNSSISNGNSFDADWEDFCTIGAGTCP